MNKLELEDARRELEPIDEFSLTTTEKEALIRRAASLSVPGVDVSYTKLPDSERFLVTVSYISESMFDDYMKILEPKLVEAGIWDRLHRGSKEAGSRRKPGDVERRAIRESKNPIR